MTLPVTRDVKRSSNLRTSKFIFEFGILTFHIRIKFALEQMWALKPTARRFNSRLLCPPEMMLVSYFPSRPRARPIPLVLPSVSQSAQSDTCHASILVD